MSATVVDGVVQLPPFSEDDCEDLLDCARAGDEEDVEDIRKLLARGVPVDHTDEDRNTALHKASANGHLAVVQLLLASGAAHTPNASGNSPLHWAVQQGQLPVAQALLAHFPDIDVLAKNGFGMSCSSEAFKRGDAKLVELMLQHQSAAKLEPEGEGEGEEELVLDTADVVDGAPPEAEAAAADEKEVAAALEEAKVSD